MTLVGHGVGVQENYYGKSSHGWPGDGTPNQPQALGGYKQNKVNLCFF